MRWSDTVEDYYDVEAVPRWGHGNPPHPRLTAILDSRRDNYRATLNRFVSFRKLLHDIPVDDSGRLGKPYWKNVWFSALDAASLVCFLGDRRPRRYLEIGSGFCTMFARYTIDRLGLPTTLVSIDPSPRADIDALCDSVVRSPLERCDSKVFTDLEAGDILFFDGTHRVFENSDATVFFLEVLPQIKPGVLIHIHDIFLPCDYVPSWNARLYSEQYLLAAMLLCEKRPFEVVLPNYYVSTDPQMQEDVKAILKADPGGTDLLIHYFHATDIPGVSFWIETI